MGPEHMDNVTVWTMPLDGGEPVRLGNIYDMTLSSLSEVFMMPTEDEAAPNDLDLLEVL